MVPPVAPGAIRTSDRNGTSGPMVTSRPVASSRYAPPLASSNTKPLGIEPFIV